MWQGHLENGNGRESRDCPESGIAFRRFKHSVRATPLFTINILKSTSRLSLYTLIHSTTLWPSKRPPSAQDIHIPRSKHWYGGISSTDAIVVPSPSSPVLDANPPNMTVVSNDPIMWPLIHSYRMLSYFVVAACTVVIYDWALTIGQEFELIWRQRWSLMTVLYLALRLAGILFCVLGILSTNPSISLTDAG